MTAKERILMIRLIDKMEQYPAYAKALVIEADGGVNQQNTESNLKGFSMCKVHIFKGGEGLV